MNKKQRLTVGDAELIKVKDSFDFCALHESELTEAQKEFLKSLRRQYYKTGELTEKQRAVLWDIERFLRPDTTLNVRCNY